MFDLGTVGSTIGESGIFGEEGLAGMMGGDEGVRESGAMLTTSGGPFTSGAVSFGGTSSSKNLLIIGAIAIAILFLWKR